MRDQVGKFLKGEGEVLTIIKEAIGLLLCKQLSIRLTDDKKLEGDYVVFKGFVDRGRPFLSFLPELPEQLGESKGLVF
jgi:hypothetical protein